MSESVPGLVGDQAWHTLDTSAIPEVLQTSLDTGLAARVIAGGF